MSKTNLSELQLQSRSQHYMRHQSSKLRSYTQPIVVGDGTGNSIVASKNGIRQLKLSFQSQLGLNRPELSLNLPPRVQLNHPNIRFSKSNKIAATRMSYPWRLPELQHSDSLSRNQRPDSRPIVSKNRQRHNAPLEGRQLPKQFQRKQRNSLHQKTQRQQDRKQRSYEGQYFNQFIECSYKNYPDTREAIIEQELSKIQAFNPMANEDRVHPWRRMVTSEQKSRSRLTPEALCRQLVPKRKHKDKSFQSISLLTFARLPKKNPDEDSTNEFIGLQVK